jgi:N-acyl-D-amino-acid deacylase
MLPLLLLCALQSPVGSTATVIQGGLIYDGSGGRPFRADLRIEGDHIVEVGRVKIRVGDRLISAKGLAVAPGFIDAHSHADGDIFTDPEAETHIRQGITTSVVGEDGGSSVPVSSFFDHLKAAPAALNFASFVGHGSVRGDVMGTAERAPTPEELDKMRGLVEESMKEGALGLSTGLEYVPNRYAKTDEVIELSKVAARYGGIYISHMRNEDNHSMEAIRELIAIARGAKIPAEINHIKLGSERVWGRAGEVGGMMLAARKEGLDITADVYPYIFWQSTIRVIIETEQFDDRKQWDQGFKDIGGPGHVLLTAFSPDPSWAGHTLEELSKMTGKDAITLAQEIIKRTEGREGQEGVVVTAMSEKDLETFIANPLISFCSDGGLHGTHPRGAGSFPRVLGRYVREKHVISLPEAIRKMTSLPAHRFGFSDRGQLKVGMKADVVLFDPKTVIDRATTKDPEAQPVGLFTVLVNGVPVLLEGKITGNHPGQVLTRTASHP